MANELKIIIDADVERGINGVQRFSKVVAGDFVGATKAASAATADLSKQVNASVEKINASLSSLKITSLDVNINTSSIDSSIKNIQAKFAQLVDPELNVLANTSQAEVKINELLSDLSSLEGSELFIKANDTQAIAAIKDVKAELSGLLNKQIRININSAGAEKNVNELSATIETLRGKLEARKFFITTETDITKVAAYNKEIELLEKQILHLQNVGKRGFELFVVPNQTINSVKNLAGAVAAFGGGVTKYIPPAIQGFNKFASSTDVLSHALQRTSGVTNTSTASLINFGRVIQDAPFGILGIANNFNPLVESLQRSSIAAKETGTSLTKNLLGALAGPAGIGVAISALSSLLIVFGDDLFGATKEVDKAADAFGRFNEKIQTAKSSLENLKIGIDFRNQLKGIKAEAGGLTGGQLDIFNLQNEIKSNSVLIKELDKQADQISKPLAKINQKIEDARLELGKTKIELRLSGLSEKEIEQKFGDPIERFFSKFKDPINIPESALEQLNEKDRAAVQQIIKLNKDLDDVFKQRESLINQNDLNIKRISVIRQKELEKIQDEILKRARQFAKEFGDAFVVPDLEESFFRSKSSLIKPAAKLLDNVESFLRGNVRSLKIKLPVQPEIEFLPVTEGPSQDIIDNFFKSVAKERNISVGPTKIILSKELKDLIDQQSGLRKQFSILGDLGLKEFNKIFKDIDSNNFSNLSAGIEEATKRLQGMMAIATTLNQAIGQGLTNAFNSVFDAILEGKSVFKALANAVKELIVTTIKAVAQMLILKLVTNFIFPGAGSAGGLFKPGFFSLQANPSNFGSLGIGSRAFQNVLTVNVVGQISGDAIRLAGQRAGNSSGRVG